MNELNLLSNYLLLGSLLFVIGMVGFIVRRNMIVMFLCAEMMLQGVALSFAAWSRFHHDWGGQVMVIFMIAVAACEAGIALALILMLFHRSDSLDIVVWQDLRESILPPYVDRQIPEEMDEDRVWPTLTPAGIEPDVDIGEQTHRPRI
ncbi:MAG: NADH-quinone oxidoreductase subunit NuoK [Pirellulaceae bacterium]|nr:NADH-quinone oxidoreductase subunit NuoK [Planctomycetaceae bacterium]